MNKTLLPLVSICCITYNHEKYIKDAIESFLMQKTNFNFEIIINDDASTDKTAEIIRSYEAIYPNIVKPTYQTENQYSKGIRGIAAKFTFPRAKGKYIAMCEGDDYWTDPLKLQKQVDFMEANEGYSLCFHDVICLNEGKLFQPRLMVGKYDRNTFQFSDLINEKPYIPTNSMMFHAKFLKAIPDCFYKYRAGEVILQYHLALCGEAFYFEDIMSVYRMNSGGLSYQQTAQTVYDIMIPIYDEFNKLTNYKFNKEFSKRRRDLSRRLSENNLKNKLGLFYLLFYPRIMIKKILNILT